MKRFVLSFSLSVLVLMSIFVAACYVNPQTHRRALVLFTPQEESTLGLQTFTQIKSETPISTDPAHTELVQRVGQKISTVVELPYAQWEFVMFREDQTANAFCLPGGKVGVYTGILSLTQSDAGLAVVVGHEVAHAVARHGGERMSEQLLLNLGGIALSAALQQKPAQTQELAMLAYGVGSAVGVSLPHSRKQELEADYMGLIYMAKAGYDPREAVNFWTRFKAYADQQGSRMPEFLSTHPMDNRRINELQKHMPEALAIYQGQRP
ncbi:M48 family peptidase [candidate division KSB1 bacterium]|nr:MAG: M48 family peptidase [candidate division KSB1 bacterium]